MAQELVGLRLLGTALAFLGSGKDERTTDGHVPSSFKVMDRDVTVLLIGETGTGKEAFARAIHFNGLRKQGRFVAANCGALTETLLESELIGHKKGSFTGAIEDKVGLLEAANGGTIFLDEASETSPGLQVKLLRALQEGEVTRVGELEPRNPGRVRESVPSRLPRLYRGLDEGAGRLRLAGQCERARQRGAARPGVGHPG